MVSMMSHTFSSFLRNHLQSLPSCTTCIHPYFLFEWNLSHLKKKIKFIPVLQALSSQGSLMHPTPPYLMPSFWWFVSLPHFWCCHVCMFISHTGLPAPEGDCTWLSPLFSFVPLQWAPGGHFQARSCHRDWDKNANPHRGQQDLPEAGEALTREWL